MINNNTKNLLAKQYMQIKEQIEALEAQKAELKKTLQDIGEFDTGEYEVSFSTFEVERMASVDKCVSKLGRQALRGLINKSEQTRMDVKKKAKALDVAETA